MTRTVTFDDLAPEQRDALRELSAAGRDGAADSAALADAREAFVALAGDPGDAVGPDARARVGDHLLGRESPGRAAATWRLLEEDEAAAAWASRLRDALRPVLGDTPPSLPTDDDPTSPTDRTRLGGDDDAGPGRSLAERRAARSRRRTAQNAQQAAAELMSPFRSEAVDAQRNADDRVELPDFAPRPVRFALYALVVALVAGLAFAIVARVPVNTSAIVLVTRVPASAPGAAEGFELVVLLPDVGGTPKDADTGADVRRGDVLRVALPGQDRRTPTTIRSVTDRRLSPREVVQRFRLPVGQANLVTSPGYVAIAPIRPPAGRTARSYEGTTTTEASVQTGSQRIISLLF